MSGPRTMRTLRSSSLSMGLCANAVIADNMSDKPNSVSVRFIRFTLLYKKCLEYVLPTKRWNDGVEEWNIQQIRPTCVNPTNLCLLQDLSCSIRPGNQSYTFTADLEDAGRTLHFQC